MTGRSQETWPSFVPIVLYSLTYQESLWEANRMVREMASIKSEAGMSREEFIRKYEEELVPLILRLCPGTKKRVRNYVRARLTAPDPNALAFDCITEVWHEYMEALPGTIQPRQRRPPGPC